MGILFANLIFILMNWFLADAGHGDFLAIRAQNTVQSTSPPTLASRASWSAITPLGVRPDRDAQAVVDARQVADRNIDAASRLGHPRHFADHRLHRRNTSARSQARCGRPVIDRRVAADEALVLEHVEDADAQSRARRRNLRLLAHLRIGDARNQVADRIVQLHATLLTSSTSTGPGSGPWNPIHAARCGSSYACDNMRAAGR